MDNKGGVKTNVIIGVFVTIIAIIILVQFTGASMSAFQEGSDTLREQPCQGAGGFWNATNDGICQINSTNQTVISNFTDFPLAGTYARQTGVFQLVILAVVLLISMAALFFFFTRNK